MDTLQGPTLNIIDGIIINNLFVPSARTTN